MNLLRYGIRLNVLLSLVLITACGFQLRGTGQALDDYYTSIRVINDTEDQAFGQLLEQTLTAAGVEVNANASNVLKLRKIVSERRTASYSNRAKSAEFELLKDVSFSFRQGTEELAANNLKSRRSYLYRETAAVGKAEEERLLLLEMDRDLVYRIILAIQQTAVNDATKTRTAP